MRKVYLILAIVLVALLVAIPLLAQAEAEPETFSVYLPEVRCGGHCVYWPECVWCVPGRCYMTGW